MTDWKPDLEKYQKMAEPFETREALQEALNGFFEEVGQLREKYKMTSVEIVCLNSIKEIGDCITNAFYGHARDEIALCAWALGKTREENAHWLAGLIAGKK